MSRRLSLFFSFWAYPPLSGLFLYWGGVQSPARNVVEYPVLIVYGILLWTLVEYLMHRFLFHPGNGWESLARVAEALHGVHHRRPRDPNEILASARTSIPPSVVIIGLVWIASRSIFTTAGVMSGVWMGFVYYEWVHYRVHMTNASGLIDWHRRHHFHHHFVDERRCFGITSPLWDVVLGTLK
jgi:sterol desaturase/sphingolipid hydroxylase (fatty acid hydroxylase superfamily)